MKQTEVDQISNHITEYSLNILSRSIIDASFSEYPNGFSHSMALVWAIQMLELFIKSKIFKKDKTLIFKNNNIDFFDTKTINIYKAIRLFKELFNIKIDEKEVEKIINKRNQLVHFWINDHDYSENSKIVLKFIFEIIMPILEENYKNDLEYVFDWLYHRDEYIFWNDDWFIELLESYEIKFSKLIRKKFTYDN